MTWPSATLSSPNYTSLRGSSWQGASYACLCPNTVVWSTTLSATATGGTNATISYGATITGNAANVQIGQRVLIGSANDIRKATFSGRVRTAPAGGILGINETSAALTSGYYLWVVDDYPLLDKLARPVGDPPVQYKDYDLAYEGLKPVVVGIQLGYAGFINASNVLRIAFNASSSFAAESGATISSYQYTFAASSYTVISGALNTSTVTLDFNEGFQWGKLVVTDSGGRTQTRHFMIFACGNSTTPALSFQGASITANLQEGWNASVTAYADVSSVLDNTPVVIFTQEYYSGTEGPINNNVDMVGWLRHEADPAETDLAYSLVTSSNFEIVGVGSKLARLEAQLLALSNVANPTLWDQINNLTPWRGIVHFLQRHTTALELCDLTFDSTANTFLFPYLTTQGGNALAAMNGIANQINAALEFAPDGAMRVVRDARFLGSTARNALLTYGNWTAADYADQGISLQYTHDQDLGKVDADGLYFDSVSSATPAFRCRAPGLAQDAGQTTVNLNNQILSADVGAISAQSELNQRAGNQYEISKTPSYTLPTTHPDSYHFLVPSKAIWYTWTLTAGTDNIRGISYDTTTRWLLLDANITIDNDTGARSVHVTYIRETPIGNPATTIIIPPPGSIDLTIPAFPPFDPFPLFPDNVLSNVGTTDLPPYVNTGMTGIPGHHIVAPTDGNTVAVWDSTHVWVTRSFKARSTPVWTEVTPSGISAIRDVKFTPTGQGLYVLADTTGSGNVTQNIDFTAGDGGFSLTSLHAEDPLNTYTPDFMGAYTAGVGWTNTATVLGATDHQDGVHITQAYGSARTITSVEVQFDRTVVNSSGITIVVITGLLSGVVQFSQASSSPGPTGTNQTFSWSGSASIDTLRITENNGECIGACTPGGTCTIKTSTLIIGNPSGQAVFYATDAFETPIQWTQGLAIGAGTYTNLRTTSTSGDVLIYNPGGADVRLSTNHGYSFAAAVSVGTTPGATGGFDVNKIGNTSIVAQDQKTRSATTLGGAYADTTGGGTTGAEPLTVYIGRFKFGGTTTNASLAAPDFALGASASVGGEAFWKVSGGVQTAMSPSHSGTLALAFAADAICMSYLNGKIIAYLAKVSGTAYLFTTSSGTAWTDRGSVSGALAVRIRKSDLTAAPALFIAGGTVLKYSPDLGATLQDRTKPVASGLLGIEVLG